MTPFLAPPVGRAAPRTEPPTFSVVIAAYNAAATVGEAVASALEQTYPPLEVIVSDDGSTDDFDAAVAPYRERIEILRGSNRGPGAARNDAFRRAKGEFVAILDADDLFLPGRLAAFAELLAARPDLDILTTDAFMELDGKVARRIYDQGWSFETRDQRDAIVTRNFIFGLAAVRRERVLALGGMDEARELVGVEDWDLWIRLILSGSVAGLVDRPLARNRLSPGSLSSQRESRLQARISLLEKTARDPHLRPAELRALRRALARQVGELRFTRARSMITEARPGARRAALAAALTPTLRREQLRPRSRLRALGWASRRRSAGTALLEEGVNTWEGAGSLRHVRELPLRVAFYCDSPELGGAERSLGTLLEQLDERIDATVVGTRTHVVDWLAARRTGATAVVLPHVQRKRDLRAIAAHFGGLRRLRPDVVHLNLAGAWESHWAVLAALATPHARTISVVHLPLPARSRRQRAIKRLTGSRIAAHVTVGEGSARELEALAGLPWGSVRVIPNGVEDVELEPLARPAAGPTVGSIGRLEHQKGFDVLLRALAQLPDATLVLVGEGSQRESLSVLARDLGVAERVVFVGASEQARRHLTTFDVFVLPSRFEASPLVVTEAMLAALPVVASDVGSVSDQVVDGRTGLLVSAEDPSALADALASLLRDPGRRRELGDRGRERALEGFRADVMARAYERLYDEVAR